MNGEPELSTASVVRSSQATPARRRGQLSPQAPRQESTYQSRFSVLTTGATSYLDFKRLYGMHQVGAFFVTRAKRDMGARRVYSSPCDRSLGVICDQRIMLKSVESSRRYPEHLRRIRYRDPETAKTLVFLTNNTALPALTIAALYKSRWKVELFFKWIKQHLRIKRFLGNSENAVKTQVWCAVATYVLVAIAKKQLQLSASLYTCLQVLSVSVFEKSDLSEALRIASDTEAESDPAGQLDLFAVTTDHYA